MSSLRITQKAQVCSFWSSQNPASPEVAAVPLTTHFTLHRKLRVLGMTLRTKVSPQRQVWTAAAVQVTRRHTASVADEEDAEG